jgi:hypothetical protein
MADGSSKPISDVEVGDLVLATDPETGESGPRPVAALIRHGGDHTMVDLTFDDGSVIESTDEHPFWDVTDQEFTFAVDLEAGDVVLSVDGDQLALVSARVYEEDVWAYNLEVAGIHTYYAGETPVLVHNSCRLSPDALYKQGVSRYGLSSFSNAARSYQKHMDSARQSPFPVVAQSDPNAAAANLLEEILTTPALKGKIHFYKPLGVDVVSYRVRLKAFGSTGVRYKLTGEFIGFL